MGNLNLPHNPNLNPNQNIHNISVESRDPTIVLIARGGVGREQIKNNCMGNHRCDQ